MEEQDNDSQRKEHVMAELRIYKKDDRSRRQGETGELRGQSDVFIACDVHPEIAERADTADYSEPCGKKPYVPAVEIC